MFTLFLFYVFIKCIVSTSPIGIFTEEEAPRCSTECAVTGLQKFLYSPSKTYTYDYKGSASVTLEGVPGAASTLSWHVEVDLTWTGPCDAMLQLRDPVIFGSQEMSNKTSEILTAHPIAVATSGGMIQHLCVHPEETTESLNFKKGLVSILQNSLPSLSLIHSGKSYTERDAVGECETLYTVESRESKVVVTKFKNHKECSRRVSPSTESLLSKLFYSSPYPLVKSQSTCQQEIEKGIFKKVICNDQNIIRATFSSGKYLNYKQESLILYRKEKTGATKNVTDIEEFRRTDLMFEEHDTEHQAESLEARVENIINELCQLGNKSGDKRKSHLASTLIKLLEKVKTKTLVKLYRKIKLKELCRNFSHLESVFLDILSFVRHEGAFKLMIRQLLSGQATGLRREMYIASIFLSSKVSAKSVEYLIPVFEYPSASSPELRLASGNLIRNYCLQYPECSQHPPVQAVFRQMSQELKHSCSLSSKDEKHRLSALATLKSIGNIGFIDQHLEEQVFKCVMSEDAEIVVRVAGVQSFRQMDCSKQIFRRFLSLLSDEHSEAELRIAAYLEIMRCADEKDLQRILSLAFNATDIEVSSFIVTHLNEIMKRSFPYPNEKVKAYLSIFPPPSDVGSQFYSRSGNVGYFMKSLGTGLNLNTNTIKFTKLLKYDTELSVGYLFHILHNIVEHSIRINNYDTVFTTLVGGNSSSDQNMNTFMTKWVKIIINKATRGSNQETTPDGAASMIDMYLRLFGAEVFFMSFNTQGTNYQDQSWFNRFWSNFFSVNRNVERTLKDLSSTRVLHFDSQAIVTTVHGIPLKVAVKSTALIGLSIATGSLPYPLATDEKELTSRCLFLTPELSTYSEIFAGFDFGHKVGVKVSNKLNLLDIQLHLTLPETRLAQIIFPAQKETTDVFSVENEINLISRISDNGDSMVIPAKTSTSRIKMDKCLPSDLSVPGYRLCWKYSIPECSVSNMFCFEKPSALVFYFKKHNPNVKQMTLTSSWITEKYSFVTDVRLEAPDGTDDPNFRQVNLNFINKENGFSLASFIKRRRSGTEVIRGLKISMETTRTRRGFMKDVSVFLSNTDSFTSSDKVVCFKYNKGREDNATTTVDIQLQTINNLRAVMKINFQADFDYSHNEAMKVVTDKVKDLSKGRLPIRIPLKKSLGTHLKKLLNHPFDISGTSTPNNRLIRLTFDNLEVEVESGTFRAIAFIQRVLVDSTSSQYRFWSSVTSSNHRDTSLKGDLAFKGLKKDNVLVLASNVYSQTTTDHYHAKIEMSLDDRALNYKFQIDNLKTSELLLLARYVKAKESFNTVHFVTEAELYIRGFVSHFKIEGTILETEKDSYLTKLELKKDGVLELTTDGHVTLHSDSHSLKEQLVLNISVKDLNPAEIRIGYDISDQRSKLILSMKVNGQLMYVKSSFQRPQGVDGLYSLSADVQIPKIINAKFEGNKDLEAFTSHSVVNILPETSSSRTLKGYCHNVFETKTLDVTLYYEVNQRYEKLAAEAHYEISLEERFASVKGRIKTSSEEYVYVIEGDFRPQEGYTTKRHLVVEVTKSTGEKFQLETLYSKEDFDQQKGDFTVLFHLLTFDQNDFRWYSSVCYAFDNLPEVALISGTIEVRTPWINETTITVDTYSNKSEEHHFFFTKVSATRQGFRRPVMLQMQLSYSLADGESEQSCCFFLPLPSRLSVTSDLHNIGKKSLTNVSLEAGNNCNIGGGPYLLLNRNGNRILGFSFKEHNDTQLKAEFYVSSRTIILSARIFFKEESYTLYPNLEWNSTSGNEDLGNLDAVKTLSNMAIRQTTMQGQVEVTESTFNHEKILVSLESVKLANNSYKSEVIFRADHLTSSPRILFEVSFSPSIKSVVVSYRPDAALSPSLSLGWIFLISPANQKTFYGHVGTSKYEAEASATSGGMQRARLFPHNWELGHSNKASFINGTIRTSLYGTMDYYTTICSYPLMVEVAAKGRENASGVLAMFEKHNTHLLVKIKDTNNSPDEEQNDQQQTFARDGIQTSVQLVAPSIVSFQQFFSLTELGNVVETLRDGIVKALYLTRKISSGMLEELTFKTLESDEGQSQWLSQIYEQVRHELLSLIFEDMKLNNIFPDPLFWKERLKQLLENVMEFYTRKAAELRQILSHFLMKIYDIIIHDFDDVNNFITKSLQDLIHGLQSNYRSLKRAFSDYYFYHKVVEYFYETNVWKWLRNTWKEIYFHVGEEIFHLTSAFQLFQTIVRDEWRELWKHISSHKAIVSFFDDFQAWSKMTSHHAEGLRRGLNQHMCSKAPATSPPKKGISEIFSNLMQYIFTFEVKKQTGKIRVTLPLKRPAFSLQKAVVGLPENVNQVISAETLESIITDVFRIPKRGQPLYSPVRGVKEDTKPHM